MLDPAKVENLKKIKYFRAPDDGRVVAIFITRFFDLRGHSVIFNPLRWYAFNGIWRCAPCDGWPP